MEIWKPCEVITLPTEDYSKLGYIYEGECYHYFTNREDSYDIRDNLASNHHMYIVSDEKIEKGNKFLVDGTNYIGECIGYSNGNPIDLNAEHCDCKKIIASTDKKLNVLNIYDKDLEQWTKNPVKTVLVQYEKYHGINTSIAEVYAISETYKGKNYVSSFDEKLFELGVDIKPKTILNNIVFVKDEWEKLQKEYNKYLSTKGIYYREKDNEGNSINTDKSFKNYLAGYLTWLRENYNPPTPKE